MNVLLTKCFSSFNPIAITCGHYSYYSYIQMKKLRHSEVKDLAQDHLGNNELAELICKRNNYHLHANKIHRVSAI